MTQQGHNSVRLKEVHCEKRFMRGNCPIYWVFNP